MLSQGDMTDKQKCALHQLIVKEVYNILVTTAQWPCNTISATLTKCQTKSTTDTGKKHPSYLCTEGWTT